MDEVGRAMAVGGRHLHSIFRPIPGRPRIEGRIDSRTRELAALAVVREPGPEGDVACPEAGMQA